MNKQVFSKAGELIKQDFKKIGKGFIIAITGAAIAFLGDASGLIDYSQYGQYGPMVALAVGSLCSSLVNLLRKYVMSNVYLK